MFVSFRGPDTDGVGAAFTNRQVNLGDAQPAGERAAAFRRVSDALGVPIAVVTQVHGADVVEVTAPAATDGLIDLTAHDADALVTTEIGVGLAVRVADCVPVLFADADAGVIAAAHAGRRGLLSGVLAATVGAMRARGASDITAWVGPHICGACYEVPADMAADAAAQLHIPEAQTSWGTPAIDQTAAVRRQLDALGVRAEVLAPCTREGDELYSYRREQQAAGRLAGIVWRTARRDSGVGAAR